MPSPSCPCPARADPLRQLMLACLLAASGVVLAGEKAAPKAAKAADKTPVAAAPAAESATPQDPLDRLRERLATRLGASKPASAQVAGGAVVQVSNRAAGEFQIAAGRPAGARAGQASRARLSAKDAPAAGHVHWGYQGAGGPQHWGSLRSEFSACGKGQRQSPIDIRDGFTVDLEPVHFDYRPSRFSVIDNGHTVQVNVAAGNIIETQGRVYELAQFHFHRPSEERINGRAFDMVAHLVHKDVEGRLAVIAVLLDRGAAQPLIQTVWNNLPLEKGEAVPARVTLDVSELLPTDRRYYTYMGSLTTPPCSEGVLWMVMQQPVTLSAEQIDLFARLYPMNARPLQSASGRLIKQSN
jgi:carbonic anhydrase